MFGLNPTDKCFARFCRTGDPEALGEVFDRTSGRLMKVALWLTKAQADAEDVLQRTFLQAIETRGQFRQGSAAMPWLMGLLGNQVRKVRSERDRARVEGLQADQLVDPEVEVSSSELEHWVQKAAKEVGEPYGEVLRLHLEQGLNAKEIAACLDRPAGTVRTQLMRGLAHVRDRMPVGFVANSALVSADAPALEAVRAALLASAGASVPSVSVGVATGVLGALTAAKWFLLAPVAAAAVIAWASPSLGAVAASMSQDTAVIAQGVEEPTEEDLKPTGDADLDELRRWVMKEPIQTLIDKRLVFLACQFLDYRNDKVLWKGVEKLAHAIIDGRDLPDRRIMAISMAQIIELAEPELNLRLRHLVKPLRDIGTRNARK